MQVNVETNKNVIFFETLNCFLFEKDLRYHPIGEQIIKEFDLIKGLQSFNDLKILKEKGFIGHPWRLVFLSIHTNNDLSSKPIDSVNGFGPNTLKAYSNNMFSVFNGILKESDFDSIYISKIKAEYESLAGDIQRIFEKDNPGNILMNFWNGPIQPDLVFIPDPLRVAQGFGVSRENTFYSVTGAIRSRGRTEFVVGHMIPNLFHEFSHSFFTRYMDGNSRIHEKNEMLCHVLSDKVKKSQVVDYHGTVSNYFEETFMKAIQTLLSQRYFEQYMGKDRSHEKVEELIVELNKNGYIHVKEFYNEIKTTDDPMESYIRVLEKLAE